MRYHVYILAGKSRVLYVGVTGFLMSRVLRHKSGHGGAFTRKYRVHRLVYTQAVQNIGDAIARETQIKGWSRDKKLALIHFHNPTWEDLAEGWGQPARMQFQPMQVPPIGRNDNPVVPKLDPKTRSEGPHSKDAEASDSSPVSSSLPP